MREKYLITYMDGDNSRCTELLPMRGIADRIGCNDLNECRDFKVFRFIDGEPYKCIYDKDRKTLMISLYDQFGNFVDSAEYPEH